MIAFLAGFVPDLLRGMLVNFEIAGLAMVLGVAAAVPIIAARLRGGAVGTLAGLMVSVMWALPTFIVMFFLANVVPNEWTILGRTLRFTGLPVVVVSLAVFATAYVADNGLDAIRHLRRGNQGSALLFLPQLARAFFVLVTSSSQAAALGVLEAVTITLRQGDRLPELWQRLLLFLGVVLVFVALQRTAFSVIDRYRTRMLARHVSGLPQ